MQRVNRSSAVLSLPAAPAGGTPGFFTGGNPGLGQQATVPGYEWFNAVQEELLAVILRGGLTPSGSDLAQARKSLDRLFGGAMATYSANTTLTVDDAGLVLVNASGGARTITLPAANALGGRPMRFQIHKTDGTANAVTVQRAGADTIEGATSVLLGGQWASVTLISDGVASWVAVRGRLASAAETDAGNLSDLAVTPAGLGISTRLFAASGYQRLPGGLLLQWGQVTLPATGVNTAGVSVTFPLSFPSACRTVLPTPAGGANAGAGGGPSMQATGLTTTGCNITGDTLGYTTFNQGVVVRYLAVGN
jgi:hypothetical protein